MALFYPDILEHNNPNKPLMDDGQLAGGFQVVANKTARNAIGEDKRKIGSVVSWIEGSDKVVKKFIGPNTTNTEWTDDLNWQDIMFPFMEENRYKILSYNDTTTIVLGDKTLYTSFVLRYQMIRDTVIAMGVIEVMQNQITFETPVYFTLRELGGLIGLVDITAAYNVDNIELSIEIDNSSAVDVTLVYDIQRKPYLTIPLAWVQQTEPLTEGFMYGVSFTDANNGWSVGQDTSNGAMYIMNTTDGGVNWVNQPIGGVALGTLHSVCAVSTLIAYACGVNVDDEFVIYKTTDGGANWNQQTSLVPIAIGLSIFFIDANTGWACGSDGGSTPYILATTDGGTNWNAQTAATAFGDLWSVFFIDANTGWICGTDLDNGDSLIMTTTDGGANWIKRTIPLTTDDFQLYSIFFINANTGWAVGANLFSIGMLIYKSTDGGVNWTAQTSPMATGVLWSVFFVDANHGWAVGTDITAILTVILHTSNGGTSWESQSLTLASGYTLHSVFALNNNLAYAVGENGANDDITLKYS